jgi:hypothetical protein
VLASLGAAGLTGAVLLRALGGLAAVELESLGMPAVLILPPLLVLGLAVVARLGLAFGRPHQGRRELERLVGRKRRGLLTRGLRRIIWRPTPSKAPPALPPIEGPEPPSTAIRRRDGTDYRAADAPAEREPQ